MKRSLLSSPNSELNFGRYDRAWAEMMLSVYKHRTVYSLL